VAGEAQGAVELDLIGAREVEGGAGDTEDIAAGVDLTAMRKKRANKTKMVNTVRIFFWLYLGCIYVPP
jgi:hypothetical protein